MPVLSPRSYWIVAAFKILVITLVVAGVMMAQAGRHIPKGPEPTPAPVSTPSQVYEPKAPPKPSFVLKVVSDLPFGVYQIFPKPELMPEWAIERLRTSMLLDVRDGGIVNRRDAVKQAKGETEAYVIWLQLQEDSFGAAGNRPGAGEVSIYYEILSPVTGKTKTMGTIGLNRESINGRPPTSSTIVRSCHQGVYGNDFILLQASLVAAERVMASFNIPIPPDCRLRPTTVF